MSASNSAVAILLNRMAEGRANRAREAAMAQRDREFELSQQLDRDRMAQQQSQFEAGRTDSNEHFNKNYDLQTKVGDFNINSAMAKMFGEGVIAPADLTPTETNMVPGQLGLTTPMENTISLGGRPVVVQDQFAQGLRRNIEKHAQDQKFASEDRELTSGLLRSAGMNPMEIATFMANPAAGTQYILGNRDFGRVMSSKIMEAKSPEEATAAMKLLAQWHGASQAPSRTNLENSQAEHFRLLRQSTERAAIDAALIRQGNAMLPEIIAGVKTANPNIAPSDIIIAAYQFIQKQPWDNDKKSAAVAALRAESNLNAPLGNPMQAGMAGLMFGEGGAVPALPVVPAPAPASPTPDIIRQFNENNAAMLEIRKRMKEQEDEIARLQGFKNQAPSNDKTPPSYIEKMFPNRRR